MTITQGIELTTPVGRIVWGNPLRASAIRDDQGKPKLDPETGQPLEQWAFGLAIPKNDCGELFQAMQGQAGAIYPDGRIPPSFAWKFVDGDGIDNDGDKYSDREGYAGCYVFAFSTQYAAPGVFQNQNGSFVQLSEGIKCGDYARVRTNIKAHTSNSNKPGSKPGLYLNPNLVELVGYGTEIRKGPSPEDAFGKPAALPPGASATPVASGPMPGIPGASVPGQAPAVPGVPGMPPQAPVAAPQAPSAPAAPQAPGIPGAPVAAPTAPQAPVPPGPGAPPPHYAPHYDFLKGPQNTGQ